MTRIDKRHNNDIRPLTIERGYTRYSAGSVLVSLGHTKVLCTASVEEGVPRFLRDSGQGWVTAEYAMLPSSTHTRMRREVSKGKPSGRTTEIQRLIGRSLRAVIDMSVLGENTIQIDADVIQADGGTRTAAITGSMVALYDAVDWMISEGMLTHNPIKEMTAAVSVGKVGGECLLDLCYEEDSEAEVDMNFVMTESGRFVEIQGTAEQDPFDLDTLNEFRELAAKGTQDMMTIMRQALNA